MELNKGTDFVSNVLTRYNTKEFMRVRVEKQETEQNEGC